MWQLLLVLGSESSCGGRMSIPLMEELLAFLTVCTTLGWWCVRVLKQEQWWLYVSAAHLDVSCVLREGFTRLTGKVELEYVRMRFPVFG